MPMSLYPMTKKSSFPMSFNPFSIYNKCIEMRLSLGFVHLITCIIRIFVLIYAIIIHTIVISIHIYRPTNITITYV